MIGRYVVERYAVGFYMKAFGKFFGAFLDLKATRKFQWWFKDATF